MNNIILQLREQDKNTTNYGDGDYETILTKPITIRNGDRLQLNSAFIDTRESSTQYIDIKEDTLGRGFFKIGMTFFMYNINWCGTFKNFGTDGFNMAQENTPPLYPQSFEGSSASPNVWGNDKNILGHQRQDGDPYFLCKAVYTSDSNSLITALIFSQADNSSAWGDVTITLSYYEPQPEVPAGTTSPFASIGAIPKQDITIYIPPLKSSQRTYTYTTSFVILRRDMSTSGNDALIPISQLFELLSSTKPLNTANIELPNTEAEIVGSEKALLMGPNFPSNDESSNRRQVVLIPVQQRLEIDIPAGKYLPSNLASYINDRVMQFNAQQGVGIQPVASTTAGRPAIPTEEAQQRLPINPTTVSGTNTFNNIKGMPTLTQSNYLQCPKNQEYTIGGDGGGPSADAQPGGFQSYARKVVYDVSGGDHFMCNSHPFLDIQSSGKVGGRQIYSPNSRFEGWGTGDRIRSSFNNVPSYTAAGISNPVFIGSSQFSLEFDADASNRFKFTYLHTPLYEGGGGGSASSICNYFINTAEIYGFTQVRTEDDTPNPLPKATIWMCNQKARAPITTNQTGTQIDIGCNLNGAYPSIQAYDEPKYKFVGSNGGIVFSSLYPHSFWADQLGFDLTEMREETVATSTGVTTKITQQGMITHYTIHDIGSTDAADIGSSNLPDKDVRNVFNNFGNQRNYLTGVTQPDGTNSGGAPTGTGLGQQTPNQGISPQMPSIPFRVGVNATSGRINLESTIEKAVVQSASNAWMLVQSKDNYTNAPDGQNPAVGDVSPAVTQVWTEPDITVIGAATTEIVASTPKLLNLIDNGYFLVEIDGKIQNELISSTNIKSTIQGIVNKYYNLNSYTSSDGSNIFYEHRGEPITMSSLRVRILNPDMTLADVGSDTTVFLSVVKSQEEDITAPDSILALQKQREEQQK